MSHVGIWIHAVWSTKNQNPCLTGSSLSHICDSILEHASDKGFYIATINGDDEHIHQLMLLDKEHSIATQMQLIKGECSNRASANGVQPPDFGWLSQYDASSVTGCMVPAAGAYIKNQQAHHANVTFATEFDVLVSSARNEEGLSPDDDLPQMIRTITDGSPS